MRSWLNLLHGIRNLACPRVETVYVKKRKLSVVAAAQTGIARQRSVHTYARRDRHRLTAVQRTHLADFHRNAAIRGATVDRDRAVPQRPRRIRRDPNLQRSLARPARRTGKGDPLFGVRFDFRRPRTRLVVWGNDIDSLHAAAFADRNGIGRNADRRIALVLRTRRPHGRIRNQAER